MELYPNQRNGTLDEDWAIPRTTGTKVRLYKIDWFKRAWEQNLKNGFAARKLMFSCEVQISKGKNRFPQIMARKSAKEPPIGPSTHLYPARGEG